mmetsp:Transcript_21285/g.46406  ORF Transcript_21285/g.46406 Transcript_21285/m.46406 type:complete len:191 (-) Transcript_21285:415-987(-)
MTIKGSSNAYPSGDNNIPVVTATTISANDEGEIGLSVPPTAPPMEGSEGTSGSQIPVATATVIPGTSVTTAPAAGGGGTTVTTTTYTIPAPGAATTTGDGGTATNTTQIIPISMPNLGRVPAGMQCPHCAQQMVTKTRDSMDACTIVAVVLLLLFFWPLFWLPFCTPQCKATEHYCPRCNKKVGECSACS